MAKDSGGTILLLGGLGVAVWGYFQGWFASFGFAPGAVGFDNTAAGRAAAAAAGPGSTSSAVSGGGTAAAGPPALGTHNVNAAQALQQVAANDAFILPDPATFAQLQAAPPSNYGFIQTTDAGGVFLRPDVYSAVQTLIQARVAKASQAGAAASSLQAAGQVSLSDIQQMMTNQGLTGLGDYNRHLMTRGIMPFVRR